MIRRQVRRILSSSVFKRWSVSDRLGDWLIAIVRVRHKYYEGHNRYPRLLWPKTFTEKVQWRKLFDLNPMYAIFCDKIAVRDFIAARVGPGVLIPTLWVGDDPDQIPFDELRPPYIIKSTHASGDYIRVADSTALDRADVRTKCRAWLKQPYGYDLGGEPGYDFVP